MAVTVYNQISANKARSFWLFFFFVLVIVLIGWAFGEATGSGLSGLGIALVIAGLMSFFSYWYSDKLVLTMSRATEVKHDEMPDLYHIVENLCIGAGLPVPKIYLIDDTAPNAFATGRDPRHAVVCVTTGLVDKLEKLELEGVIAHELSHIKNYDMRLMTLAVVLVGVIMLLSDWLLRYTFWSPRRRDRSQGSGQLQLIIFLVAIALAILGPIVAQLMKLAISRQREFVADASAALLTRYPEGLARALEKISADTEPLEAANKATAHLYIVNPLKGEGFMNKLFSTHPPIAERVAALRKM